MPSVDKKKKKKHSKGKKGSKQNGDKDKQKKKRFSCKKQKIESEDSSEEKKEAPLVKKKKIIHGKKPPVGTKKPRTLPSKAKKSEDGLVQLANGKRVKADSGENSGEEVVNPPVAAAKNKKKAPRKKKTAETTTTATTLPVTKGTGSDENNEDRAKKPTPAPKPRKAKTKTEEKVNKPKKSDPNPSTQGSGEQLKKESDKVKKDKEAKPPAAPVVDKCDNLDPQKMNFGAGDAVPSPVTSVVTKTESTTNNNEYLNDFDEELTQKDIGSSDQNKAKDGQPVSQPQKWREFLDKLLSRGNVGLAKTFKLLSTYLPKAATKRGFDANMDKNRFEDVICIDHTRVPLVGDKYIHASWVEISDKKKAILTQLPMGETAADFWQMVLEQDVQAILLIATAFEFRTFNGEATFPGKRDFLHFELSSRHIRVGEFDRRNITKHWTMHTICVNNGVRKKFVHVHHYYGWAHGLAPRAIADIWQIQSVLRKYSGPPVYMSLSGCGRAGTYAAFEVAHDRLHSSDYSRVDISECIKKVRKDRMHSVQRPTQLRTIYLLIAEHIVNNGYHKTLSDSEKDKLTTLIKSFHDPM